jgi:hypothetical protein
MKYLNLVLTILVLFLAVIALRLYHVEILVENSLQHNQITLSSNQAVIESNKRVSAELGALRDKVQEVEDRFSKKQ